jgi:Cu/Ag efflux protein CusF
MVFVLALGAATAGTVWSANHHSAHGQHGQHGQQSPAPSVSSEWAEAEVRRVDKAAGKITLRHGEIKNLDMPPMTMVFEVAEKSLLDQVKVGERIRFQADKSASGFVVTRIESRK